jgi:Na+/H+ antiporter NhaD/arsenite permease-like protein
MYGDRVYRPLIAFVVLAATYLGLALGRVPGFRVDRTGVAIIGATAMVVSGAIAWDAAVAAVDAHTLVLLFGMMVLAAYLRLSGFFGLVIERSIGFARTPISLLAAIIAASGVLSALFVNDVVCLVLAPLVLQVTKRLRLPPVPYLLALATAANVGSVATVTGNPQNMLVASFSGIGYRQFLLREGPIAVVGLACVFVVVWLTYRRELQITMAPQAIESVTVHYPLMTKTLVVVAVMLVAFLAGVPVALVAISGAAYSLLTRRVNPEKVYREIDWGLLVLFTGLFVVVGGVESSGLADDLLNTAALGPIQKPAVLMTVSAVLSNIVSNVPAVLLLKPVVLSSGEPTRSWLLLATASTLAGNLTILGSVANVIVVEMARRERIEIGFLAYCRVGVPLTILTLLIGWLFLVTAPL